MKVKEESESVDLKLNIQKAKIMVSSPITSWKIDALPPPEDLSDTGIKPECPALQDDSLPFEPPYTDG